MLRYFRIGPDFECILSFNNVTVICVLNLNSMISILHIKNYSERDGLSVYITKYIVYDYYSNIYFTFINTVD